MHPRANGKFKADKAGFVTWLLLQRLMYLA